MSTAIDIRVEIDTLLASSKQIGGIPSWVDTDRNRQKRWKAPLLIDGISTGFTFTVDHHFESSGVHTHFILERGLCFVRVDVGSRASHFNKTINLPQGLSSGIIIGSHHHSWKLNRHLATQKKMPEKLAFAESLPDNVKSFDSVFRWFCEQHNIECTNNVPTPPMRDIML